MKKKNEIRKLENNLTEIKNKIKYGLLSQTARKDRNPRQIVNNVGNRLLIICEDSMETLDNIRKIEDKKQRKPRQKKTIRRYVLKKAS
jgi:hypothetical protein